MNSSILQYTKGPWGYAKDFASTATIGTKDEAIAQLFDINPNRLIANAKLLAASPLMFEALQDAVDSFTPQQMSGSEWIYPNWYKLAVVALDMAKNSNPSRVKSL